MFRNNVKYVAFFKILILLSNFNFCYIKYDSKKATFNKKNRKFRFLKYVKYILTIIFSFWNEYAGVQFYFSRTFSSAFSYTFFLLTKLTLFISILSRDLLYEDCLIEISNKVIKISLELKQHLKFITFKDYFIYFLFIATFLQPTLCIKKRTYATDNNWMNFRIFVNSINFQYILIFWFVKCIFLFYLIERYFEILHLNLLKSIHKSRIKYHFLCDLLFKTNKYFSVNFLFFIGFYVTFLIGKIVQIYCNIILNMKDEYNFCDIVHTVVYIVNLMTLICIANRCTTKVSFNFKYSLLIAETKIGLESCSCL